MKLKYISSLIPAFVLVITLFTLWQIAVVVLHINNQILPTPTDIFLVLIENFSIILPHILQTLLETVIGFGIAIVLGVIIAVGVDRSALLKKAIYPILVVSQTIPMIALAPLLLLWFGFDLLPKVIIVVLYCFFPIAIALTDGLSRTNKNHINLLKGMGATKWQILYLAKFPQALPQFFSGLKIAATYAVAGAIVGEYVGAYQGLGIYMQTMANSHAVALVFAGIFITALLSLGLFGLVILVEKLIIKWK